MTIATWQLKHINYHQKGLQCNDFAYIVKCTKIEQKRMHPVHSPRRSKVWNGIRNAFIINGFFVADSDFFYSIDICFPLWCIVWWFSHHFPCNWHPLIKYETIDIWMPQLETSVCQNLTSFRGSVCQNLMSFQ